MIGDLSETHLAQQRLEVRERDVERRVEERVPRAAVARGPAPAAGRADPYLQITAPAGNSRERQLRGETAQSADVQS